jgi:hypothetical protein
MKTKLFLFTVLIFTVASACAQQDSALVGTWTHAQDGDVYTFNQNGTFSWQYREGPVTGRWTAGGDTFTLIYDDGNEWSPSYNIRSGALYINDDGPYRSGTSVAVRNDYTANTYESQLDMSSASAFISDVKKVYGIELVDGNNILSGRDGKTLMADIDKGLWYYSPEFLRKMAAHYRELGEDFKIELEASDDESDIAGYCYFGGITLFHPVNQFFETTLGHELGHAVHTLIEELAGDGFAKGFQALNDRIPYHYGEEDVWADDYDDSDWENQQKFYFVMQYGRTNYAEDMATIFERLVTVPEYACAVLSDPKYAPMLRKAKYLRDAVYKYFKDDCRRVFTAVYEAEKRR